MGGGRINSDSTSRTDLSDLGLEPNQIDITNSMASLTGAAMKGPLSNAFVFLDKHTETKTNPDTGVIELDAQGNHILIGNGIRDEDEAFAYTAQDGSYSIEVEIEGNELTLGKGFWNDDGSIAFDNTAENSSLNNFKETHSLVVKTLSTTTDASSGQPLPGVTLSAPIDAKVISPFTTLMNIGGLTSDEIKVAFGINDQVKIEDFNPYKSFSTDEIASGMEQNAVKIENLAQQIVAVTTSIAGSLEASSLTPDAAYNTALRAVISEIENSTSPVDLSTRTTLNNIANTAKVTAESDNATSFDALLFEQAQDPLLDELAALNGDLKNVTELRSTETSETYSKVSNLSAKVSSSIEEGRSSGNYQMSFDKADFGTKLDLKLGRTIPETSLGQAEFTNGLTKPVYIKPLNTNQYTNQSELRFTTNPSLEVQIDTNNLILSGVPNRDEIIQLTLGGATISLRIGEDMSPTDLQNVADQLKEKIEAAKPDIKVNLSNNASNIKLVLTRAGQEVSLNDASPIIVRSENLNSASEYFDTEVFQTVDNELISVSSFASSDNGAMGLVVELFPGPTAFYDASSRYVIHRENAESVFQPSITNLENDKFLVSWNSSIADEDGIDIDAQFFEITPDNNLSPTSLVFSVNQISAKTEHNASMAIKDNGDVLSAWTAELSSGVSEIIGGQFAATGARLGPQIIEEENLEFIISKDPEREGQYKVVNSDGSQLVSSGFVSFSGSLPSINLNPNRDLSLYTLFSDMSLPAESAIPGVSYSDVFSEALNISESEIDIAAKELLSLDWTDGLLSELQEHKSAISKAFDENGSLISFEYIPVDGINDQLIRRKLSSDGNLEETFYEATLLDSNPYSSIINLQKPETYSEDKFYFGNRTETKITPLADILQMASDDHVGKYGEIEYDKYSGNYLYKIDTAALNSIFSSSTTISGNLSSEIDSDYFSIQISEPGIVSVGFDPTINSSSTYYYTLSFLDEAGAVLATSNTGKQTSIIAEISEPGEYFVSIEAYNGFQGTNFDDGDYELKVGIPTEDNTKEESEGNDSIQTATKFVASELKEVTETYKWLKSGDFIISSGFGGLNYCPKTLITDDGREYVLWLIDTSHISKSASPFRKEPLEVEVRPSEIILTGSPSGYFELTLEDIESFGEMIFGGNFSNIETLGKQIEDRIDAMQIDGLTVKSGLTSQGEVSVTVDSQADFFAKTTASVTNQFVKGQKVKVASDPLDIEIIQDGLVITGTPMAGDEVQITLEDTNILVEVKNYGIPLTLEDITTRIQEELDNLNISDLSVVEDTSIQGGLLISKIDEPNYLDNITVEIFHSHSGSSDQTDTYIAIDDLDKSDYPNMSDFEIISNKSSWLELSEHSQLMISSKDPQTGDWSQALLGTNLGEAVTSFTVEKIAGDNAFITWNKTNDNGTSQIMASTIDLTLSLEKLALDFEKNEFLVSENAETNLSNPNLLASDDDKILVSWLGNSQDEPSQEELFYTEFALDAYLEDVLPLEGVII